MFFLLTLSASPVQVQNRPKNSLSGVTRKEAKLWQLEEEIRGEKDLDNLFQKLLCKTGLRNDTLFRGESGIEKQALFLKMGDTRVCLYISGLIR